MQDSTPSARAHEGGFSLIELLLAMTVTMVITVLASNLIAGSLKTRARENQRAEALADSQRGLYVMSREIANSGFGLQGNGIVAADTGPSSIRVRANLNAFEGQTTSNATSDSDEDVKYLLNASGGDSYIVRLDVNTGARTTILANRVDSLRIRYYDSRIDYTVGDCDITPATGVTEVTQTANARFVVMALCVQLPPVGSPGSTGYQPASRVQLTTDVALRNADLLNY
ncbi:MAG TPA: prepilin-type N-terminal cleavage/methylation domain-containing protein [Pyrinomonadaceae bacterium]|jgi:type II secretory pathway pseudopilin PulG|nr:prepilin-type N-terminal cleavage/methylation domain-containing protein [Pyrinomonadaceae bacterium]